MLLRLEALGPVRHLQMVPLKVFLLLVEHLQPVAEQEQFLLQQVERPEQFRLPAGLLVRSRQPGEAHCRQGARRRLQAVRRTVSVRVVAAGWVPWAAAEVWAAWADGGARTRGARLRSVAGWGRPPG